VILTLLLVCIYWLFIVFSFVNYLFITYAQGFVSSWFKWFVNPWFLINVIISKHCLPFKFTMYFFVETFEICDIITFIVSYLIALFSITKRAFFSTQ
jgi:hypothetical protein